MAQDWGHEHSIWAQAALTAIGEGKYSKEEFLVELATLPEMNPGEVNGGMTKIEWLSAMEELADKILAVRKEINNA